MGLGKNIKLKIKMGRISSCMTLYTPLVVGLEQSSPSRRESRKLCEQENPWTLMISLEMTLVVKLHLSVIMYLLCKVSSSL